MSKIDQLFINLKKQNRKALIAYITCGDPTLAVTEKLVLGFEKAGADIIELGIPFTDPLADGPVIQASHQRALKNNIDLQKSFALVKSLRKKTSVPLVFMAGINLIYNFGFERLFKEAERAGLDGLIIPDLPLDEELPFFPEEFSSIRLVAPNTTLERAKQIAGQTTGFVYLVSVIGITGKRKNNSDKISDSVRNLRQITDLPICIGFGISNPQQAKENAQIADGVIVGSAIVDLIAQRKPLNKICNFVSALRKALG